MNPLDLGSDESKLSGYNIFLSWSGRRSRQIADALRDWLPRVLFGARPFISTRDLDKGTFWHAELTGQLQACNVGIFCLTPENLIEPWILFEAGSLSKGLGTNRVFTYLFDLEHTDVEQPLAGFNHTKANAADTMQLVKSIAKSISVPTPDEQLAILFKALWPALEDQFGAIQTENSRVGQPVEKRTTESMFAEILEAVRLPRTSHLELPVLMDLERRIAGIGSSLEALCGNPDPEATRPVGFPFLKADLVKGKLVSTNLESGLSRIFRVTFSVVSDPAVRENWPSEFWGTWMAFTPAEVLASRPNLLIARGALLAVEYDPKLTNRFRASLIDYLE